MGVLGFSLEDFENATIRTINNAYEGYEQRERTEWHRTRWAIQYQILPHLKKSEFKKVVKSMRFDWEEQPEFQGDVDAILKKWDTVEVGENLEELNEKDIEILKKLG